MLLTGSSLFGVAPLEGIVTTTTFSKLKEYGGSDEPLITRVAELWKLTKGVRGLDQEQQNYRGVGQTGHILGSGFNIREERNIIIQNLEISVTYILTDYNAIPETGTESKLILALPYGFTIAR